MTRDSCADDADVARARRSCRSGQARASSRPSLPRRALGANWAGRAVRPGNALRTGRPTCARRPSRTSRAAHVPPHQPLDLAARSRPANESQLAGRVRAAEQGRGSRRPSTGGACGRITRGAGNREHYADPQQKQGEYSDFASTCEHRYSFFRWNYRTKSADVMCRLRPALPPIPFTPALIPEPDLSGLCAPEGDGTSVVKRRIRAVRPRSSESRRAAAAGGRAHFCARR